MALKFKNYWASALSAAAAVGDVTIYIPTGDAANLPALTSGNTCRLVLPVTDTNGNETDWEIVEVSAINTSTGALTVARGMEGTVAKAWAQNAVIELRITAAALDGLGVAQTDFGGAALQNYTDETADVTVTTATTTLDLATARVFRLAMQANTTLAFANVPTAGVTAITLICTQDATGSRTLTLPTGTKTPGASGVTLSTAAGAEDWLELVKHPDLTNWRVFAIAKAVA